MAVNIIVLGVTLLMAGYVGVWIFFPQFRTWMEMPKHRFLEQQREIEEALRNPPPRTEGSSQP